MTKATPNFSRELNTPRCNQLQPAGFSSTRVNLDVTAHRRLTVP